MSEIRATTISDLAGTGPATLTKQSAAKAWLIVPRPDTTSPAVLGGSFNISSFTDAGVGDFDASFSSAFSSVSNFSCSLGSQFSSIGANAFYTQENYLGRTASAITLVHVEANNLTDPQMISFTAHGDLA